MSIDIPGTQKDNAFPDYNYMDTYIEYITEVVLKFDHAIPETKHNPQKQFLLHKHIPAICQVFEVFKTETEPRPRVTNLFPDYSNRFTFQYIKEINPPPPKFS